MACLRENFTFIFYTISCFRTKLRANRRHYIAQIITNWTSKKQFIICIFQKYLQVQAT
jgi:hypothetical protein